MPLLRLLPSQRLLTLRAPAQAHAGPGRRDRSLDPTAHILNLSHAGADISNAHYRTVSAPVHGCTTPWRRWEPRTRARRCGHPRRAPVLLQVHAQLQSLTRDAGLARGDLGKGRGREREPPRDGGTFDVGDGALVTAADRAAADKRLAQVGLSLREARAVVAEGTSWTVQEW